MKVREGVGNYPRCLALTIIALSLSISPATAQITVERSDLRGFTIGFRGELVSGTAQLTLGASGGPQVWDFADVILSNVVTETDEIVGVLEAPQALQAAFPDAEFAAVNDESPAEWDFYSEDGEGILVHGLGDGDGSVSVSFDPPFYQIKLPLTLGQMWMDSGTRTVFDEQGQPTAGAYTVQNHVDAWGTISVPGPHNTVVTKSCLRLAVTNESGFTSLLWFSNDCGFMAAATILGSPSADPQQVIAFNYQSDIDCISVASAQSSWGALKARFSTSQGGN